ncbi:MAG: hypothetical protein ABSE62_14765 [Chthoniobacteraceae bacterium]|jgi:hypothetical protein
MRLRNSAAVLAFLLTCAPSLRAQKPDEAELQGLWTEQAQNPSGHATLAREAAAFEQRFPASPLVPVARGLGAWNLLEAGNADEARQLFEKMTADTSPTGAIGAEMARHWLTRLDRDQVVAALQQIYGQDLEYPETLAPVSGLPAPQRPPMADRWGVAWAYTPAAFKVLQTGDRQTYVLESTNLAANSDLTTALAQPYGNGFTFKAAQVMPPIAGKTVVMFRDATGRTMAISEGDASSDLGFAYAGETFLVLSNGDYWSLQPRPSP